jgi:hypothetical protein
MGAHMGAPGSYCFASQKLGGTLFRIAQKMDLRTPKVEHKKIQRGRPHIRLPDSQVLEIIRRFRAGEQAKPLANEFGCKTSDVSNWTTGKNRCSLLREIEAQERKGNLVSVRNRTDAANF